MLNSIIKFRRFTKFFSSVYTKSFVNFMSNLNVIERKKRTHLVHPNEKF